MSEVNSFKINQLQYPQNLNASTNSSPNLRLILDHCCLCQKKLERCSVSHFNITSYLITSHNIQKSGSFSINGNEHGSDNNFTKDTVIPRTGIFLHKAELDSKKVRPRILLNYHSIAEVFKHIVGEHVMKS